MTRGLLFVESKNYFLILISKSEKSREIWQKDEYKNCKMKFRSSRNSLKGSENHLCYFVLSRFSLFWLFVILWIIASQAPLSKGFSRQKYWSGLPCPPLGIFPTQGSNPCLLCLLQWQATWEENHTKAWKLRMFRSPKKKGYYQMTPDL